MDLLPQRWLTLCSPEMAKLQMLTRFMLGLRAIQGEVARIVRILGEYETREKLRELLY